MVGEQDEHTTSRWLTDVWMILIVMDLTPRRGDDILYVQHDYYDTILE